MTNVVQDPKQLLSDHQLQDELAKCGHYFAHYDFLVEHRITKLTAVIDETISKNNTIGKISCAA